MVNNINRKTWGMNKKNLAQFTLELFSFDFPYSKNNFLKINYFSF